jgi:hydrogenase maturation protein HypF
MDSYLTQKHYEKAIQHFINIFNPQIQVVLGDLHPSYFTTSYGSELAKKLNVPFKQVQHHEAHFYAIMAEHGLLESDKKVLGVIWDGTGYGHDGQIWGGEFFEYQNLKMDRITHLPYFPFILGDKMPREPRISAFSLCYSVNADLDVLQNKFEDIEWSTYNDLLINSNLQTSSIGRLFDAVACIVLDINKTSFEGEAAMKLEASAQEYITRFGIKSMKPYSAELNEISNCINEIIIDKKKAKPEGLIAAKFHLTLVHLIRKQAKESGCSILAFSGGVFQNGLLVDMIITILGSDYDLRFHQELSPNDENISFGQLAWYLTHEK